MRTYIFSGIILGLGLLISCNSEQEETVKQTPEKPTVEEVKPDKTEAKDTIREERLDVSDLKTDDEVFDYYLKLKANYTEKLKSCTPQYANQLYLEFRNEIRTVMDKLTMSETKMLEDYGEIFDVEGFTNLSGKFEDKKRKYMSNGLELWDIGEGMVEIRMKPAEVSRLFTGRVTSDFENFIQLTEMDDRHLIAADAGIAISLEEMAQTVRRWESFLQNNPKSKLKKEAKILYAMYQRWYIQGLDNTPVAEYSNGIIYKENKMNFEMYMSYYPESPTSELIKVILAAEGDYENMGSDFESKQKEILQKL